MTGQVVGRLLGIATCLALAAGWVGTTRAAYYAYAQQSTSGYAFAGAAVGAITPLSGSSAAQIG